MGTGSFGGGGSGGSGTGGGTVIGGYRFKDRKFIPKAVAPTTARKQIKQMLQKIPVEYLKRQFGSPLVLSLYEEVFSLRRCKSLEDPCEALVAEYGIQDGPGFLLRWVGALMDKYQQSELDVKVQDVARMCIEDFVIKALGDDINLYLSGTCAQVLAKLDQRILSSISGYFLGNMIWRVLQREGERQLPNVEIRIQEEARFLADRIIHDFEQRFYQKGKISYPDFFRIVQDNLGWFIGELRK